MGARSRYGPRSMTFSVRCSLGKAGWRAGPTCCGRCGGITRACAVARSIPTLASFAASWRTIPPGRDTFLPFARWAIVWHSAQAEAKLEAEKAERGVIRDHLLVRLHQLLIGRRPGRTDGNDAVRWRGRAAGLRLFDHSGHIEVHHGHAECRVTLGSDPPILVE